MRIFCLSLFVWLMTANSVFAQSLADDLITNADEVIATQVVDPVKMYGLAGYYNEARVLRVTDGKVTTLKPGEHSFPANEWLAISGRYNVLTVQGEGIRLTLSEDNSLQFTAPKALRAAKIDIVRSDELATLDPSLKSVRYSHLVLPIRFLCKVLDWLMLQIQALLGNWGLSIIAIALVLKIALLPLGLLVKRFQDDVSKTQAAMAPRLAEIKKTLKGEAAHKAFVAAHKEQGVTTFYALKPMIGLVVQIPVWIAIFNVLAEIPQMAGHGFLWVKDFAYPDALFNWGAVIPLLGNTLNLMPILMTLVTIISTLTFRDNHAPADILKKQKRNLFFMAAAFLILFYPFPSGMVFYWMLANLLNFGQQLWLAREKKTA